MNRTAIALALSATLALAACGSDKEEANSPSDPAGETQTPGTGPDGAGVPIGSIEITITHPDAEPLTYGIDCLGDAFAVTPEVDGVDGVAACERLGDAAVIDRLVNGAPADRVCTEIYGGPDLAVITGELDGQTINATIDRANGCGVDDWDSLLAGIIPSALGATE
jgi:hypothetical protein